MMTDQGLKKLMKQSSRKQLGKTVGTSVLIVCLILTLGYVGFSYHFNYWPFNHGKIAGLPNNTLRLRHDSGGVTNLLMRSEEVAEFNVSAEKAIVTIAHYQQDKLVGEEELATVGSSTTNQKQVSGHVQWGIPIREDNKTKMMISLSSDGSNVRSEYEIKTETSHGVGFGMLPEPIRIKKGIDYQLGVEAYGENRVSLGERDNGKVRVSSLKDNDDSYVLQIRFE